MTDVTDGVIPEWTLGWRLQRALDFAGITATDMADELGVARGTVSRWMNDHGAPPRLAYVKMWALRCGVNLGWLELGVGPDPSPGAPDPRDSDDRASKAKLPRVDSNHQPAGSRSRVLVKHAA